MPDPIIRYRRALFRDLDPIIELWASMMAAHEHGDERIVLAPGALPAYRSYAAYHINQEDSRLDVAELDGRVIGFMLLMISRNLPMFQPPLYGYLSDLAVTEDFRRRGIGRELVRRGSDWLRRREIQTIQLQFYNFNRSGESFWRNLGFKPYYTRMWLDLA